MFVTDNNYTVKVNKCSLEWFILSSPMHVGGGGAAVGFATLRQGDAGTDRLCNGTYETAITWECDTTKIWDPTSSTDATRFMTSFSLGLDKCFVSILSPLHNTRLLTIV